MSILALAKMEEQPVYTAAEVYDRQIRLWGLEAQRRLSSSRVLLIGAVTGALGCELAKNIALAGVGHLVLRPTNEKPSAGFLGTSSEEMVAMLSEMNPLIRVSVEEDGGEESLEKFQAVCVFGFRKEDREWVRQARVSGVPVYLAYCYGMFGVIWVELGAGRTFRDERVGKEDKDRGVEWVEKETATYSRLSDSWDDTWTKAPRKSDLSFYIVQAVERFREVHGRAPTSGDPHHAEDSILFTQLFSTLSEERSLDRPLSAGELVTEFGRCSGATIPPVAAVLGGVCANEIVKAITGKDEPINNWFFFNGILNQGLVERY